jgi:hypothetical protein
MTINEIIAKYTNCEATLDETNEALKEMQAGFHLEPNRNEIKPEEEERFGLLDTGTGTLDKVEVKDLELVNCDCGDMYALCIYRGKTYRVHGKKLEEV